jgi:hypothetical protein
VIELKTLDSVALSKTWSVRFNYWCGQFEKDFYSQPWLGDSRIKAHPHNHSHSRQSTVANGREVLFAHLERDLPLDFGLSQWFVNRRTAPIGAKV